MFSRSGALSSSDWQALTRAATACRAQKRLVRFCNRKSVLSNIRDAIPATYIKSVLILIAAAILHGST